jgi:hypothetical protein
MENGRGEKIRTFDLRYPKPSRYQAALRPDLAAHTPLSRAWKASIDTRPRCRCCIHCRMAQHRARRDFQTPC